jgi:hypothetical protein
MFKPKARNDAVSAVDLAIEHAVDLRRLLDGARERVAGRNAEEIYTDICSTMSGKHPTWEPSAAKLHALAALIGADTPSGDLDADIQPPKPQV